MFHKRVLETSRRFLEEHIRTFMKAACRLSESWEAPFNTCAPPSLTKPRPGQVVERSAYIMGEGAGSAGAQAGLVLPWVLVPKSQHDALDLLLLQIAVVLQILHGCPRDGLIRGGSGRGERGKGVSHWHIGKCERRWGGSAQGEAQPCAAARALGTLGSLLCNRGSP